MKSAKHLPAMWPSTAISPAALACAAGLWLVAFDNLGFWRALWAARAPSSLHGALAVAAQTRQRTLTEELHIVFATEGGQGLLPLWQDIGDGARFYFVHSYYVDPVDRNYVVGTTHYGLPFTSAVARDNIFAIQCHPEKSARAGLALLSNFVRWTP